MKKLTILTAFVLLAFSSLNAVTIHVPGDYPTIQAGINASSNGDIVLVEPGAYVENINFNGKIITVASYYLNDPNPAYIEQTIILGTGSSSVVTFFLGESNDAILIGFTITGGSGYDNRGGGIFCEDASPTLQNLIVTGNNIPSAANNCGGGGIYCGNSSAIISNVTIQGNSVSSIYSSNSGGGGIYLYNSDNVTLENLTIIDNSISSPSVQIYGGGIYLYNSDNVTLENLTVTNNSVSTDNDAALGGGIYLYNSHNPTLENLAIENNSVFTSGFGDARAGGIFVNSSDNVTLKNLNISSNSASSNAGSASAGGIYVEGSNGITLTNIAIEDNSVTGGNSAYGGGVYLQSSPSATLNNLTIRENLISANSYSLGGGIYAGGTGYSISNVEISANNCNSGSTKRGGGIYLLNGAVLSLTNATIVENSAVFDGAGIYSAGGVISLSNSIIWNNEIELETNTSNLTVSYCDIEDGLDGIINENGATVMDLGVNIDSDPLFVDAAGRDYHLTEGSPCIDAGSPFSNYDPDGTIADMGAYYFNQMGAQPTITVSTPTIDAYPGETVNYSLTLSISDTVSIQSIETEIPCFSSPVTLNDMSISEGLSSLDWIIEMNQNDCPVLVWLAGAEGITGDVDILDFSMTIDENAEETYIPLTVSSISFNETEYNIVYETGGINVIVIPPLLPDYGDVSLNGTISALDASLILQYLIGSIELDDQQQLNANVSGDETISAYDASLILQYGVELIDVFPAESGALAVVAMGDIYMEDINVEAGSPVTVPVLLQNGGDLFSFEFEFVYDNSYLNFNGINVSENLDGFSVIHAENEGVLNVVGAHAYEDGEEGVFINLLFDVSENFNEQSTEILLSELRLNENDILSNSTSSVLYNQAVASVSYNSGWNLVGLPLGVDDASYSNLFPESIGGTLYSYDGAYISDITLIQGEGYWLRFNNAGSTIITGTPINELTISLSEGWNLMSGISEAVSIYTVFDPDEIIVAGTLYGYDGAYLPSDELFPGKGYWLRALQDGDITLNSGTSAKAIPLNFSLKDKANSLTINGMDLFFGIEMSAEDRLSYSLPPKPPARAFDVRFQDGWRLVNDYGEVEVMNTSETLTIAYNIIVETGRHHNWILTSESGEDYILEGAREITIPSEERFILKRELATPETFTLHQNYPNPFNPTTSLFYDLSNESWVTLTIYDLMGREITQLVNTTQEAGSKSVQWDATDSFGIPVSAGVYLYQIRAGEFVQTKKMVLLK